MKTIAKMKEGKQRKMVPFISLIALRRRIEKLEEMTSPTHSCTFCGTADDTLVISAEGSVSCSGCRASKGDYECNEWLRWLKVNDTVQWDRVVDHHRLGSNPFSNLVRKIRIEP
ncbi:MAG: hypothetical protein K9G41_11450 [Flavobacteriales bacterium]|nr:hypothetical protein [Flavobacteriales bacterium]